jgi:hypothetical protein
MTPIQWPQVHQTTERHNRPFRRIAVQPADLRNQWDRLEPLHRRAIAPDVILEILACNFQSESFDAKRACSPGWRTVVYPLATNKGLFRRQPEPTGLIRFNYAI